MPANPFTPGDFPANPLAKPGYRLDIHDEFDCPTLDTRLWLPLYLPQWSSRAQSAPRYRFEDSALVLEIQPDQPPWCPEFDGPIRASSLQTGLFAGPLDSKAGQLQFSDALLVREAQTNIQLYTPQYGYFELRAKGVSTSANHTSLWMIGYEDGPERSGEICVFEQLGALTSAASSVIRYGIHPWADPSLVDDFYAESVPIDLRRYHVYAVEWTPTQVDFYLDNVKRRTIRQSPHYPMQFMLSVFEHPFEGAWSGPYDPTAPYPKTFTVDYFRAYQPLNGYDTP